MKKFLPILVIFTLIAFLFTGCGTQNEGPVITSPSTATVVVGNPFLFNVVATDPDGDTLTYEVSGPTGMVISEEGAISGWTPTAAGSETATVTVSDGKNDPVTQTLTITVITAEETLDIEISVGKEIEGAGGKTYIPGGKQDINVRFKNAYPLGDTPQVKVGSHVVPVFSADRKNWSGNYDFNVDGPEMITVGGFCAEDVCASKPVVVDGTGPFAEIKASVEECDCYEGYQLILKSDWLEEGTCAPEGEGCCGDAATGLASWNIRVYDEDPWDECCDPDPCIEPICEDEGEECPVSITCDCIDEVFTSDGWVDFFDKNYWVILSLTDEVGNETTYYGWLETDGETDELVRFVELVIDPTNPDCWCFGEDLATADLTLGDCDGTPAEVCYTDPLATCPTITLNGVEGVGPQEAPISVTQGVEYTLEIDYSKANDPVGDVSAYVTPAVKAVLPDGSYPLSLVKIDDDTYEASVTFEETGTRMIYVLDDCETCSDCTYNIEVEKVDICPEVDFLEKTFVAGNTPLGFAGYEGAPGYGLTNVDFTVKFANRVEPELVDVYVGIPGLAPVGMPIEMPLTSLEVQMQTADEVTYEGSIPIGDIKDTVINWLNHYSGANPYEEEWIDPAEPWEEIPELALAMHALGCVPMKVYVLAGDPCCVQTCEYPFVVDPIGPYADLEVTLESCTIDYCIDPGDCGPCEYPGHKLVVKTDDSAVCNPCDPLESCCGDTCSGIASWYAEVCPCDEDPFDDCCEFVGCDNGDCVNVGGPWGDDECPVEFETNCLLDYAFPTFTEQSGTAEVWGTKWYIYVNMEDNAGNVTEYKAELTINTSDWSLDIDPLCEDAEDGEFGSTICTLEP